MEQTGSVTQLLDQLAQADDVASERLWKLYFPQLVQLGEASLRGRRCAGANGEDIAASVLRTLLAGAAEGRFALGSRDELWRLLVVLARHKVASHLRHELCQKRGGGRVVSETDMNAGNLDALATACPDPHEMLAIEETTTELLGKLTETQRAVAVLRLEGHSVEEIAEQLQMSRRSVERKLHLIRKVWARKLGSAETSG